MNVKRTVTLGVVGGAVVVWLAAAATSRVPRDSGGRRRAADAWWIDPARRSPLKSRGCTNGCARPLRPIRRATCSATQRGRRPQPLDPAPVVIAPEPLAVPAASLRLQACRYRRRLHGRRGVDRTAILSGLGDLFLVKEGDMVGTRYRVVTVAPDGVDLLDLADRRRLCTFHSSSGRRRDCGRSSAFINVRRHHHQPVVGRRHARQGRRRAELRVGRFSVRRRKTAMSSSPSGAATARPGGGRRARAARAW